MNEENPPFDRPALLSEINRPYLSKDRAGLESLATSRGAPKAPLQPMSLDDLRNLLVAISKRDSQFACHPLYAMAEAAVALPDPLAQPFRALDMDEYRKFKLQESLGDFPSGSSLPPRR